MGRGRNPISLLPTDQAQTSSRCRVCRAPSFGRAWCGRRCVDAWFLATGDSRTARRLVLARDAGVCGECRLDTVALRTWLQNLTLEEAQASLLTYGWSERRAGRWPCALWEVDHVVPVVNGGTNELSNLRTLCVPCHTVATVALAKERRGERGIQS